MRTLLTLGFLLLLVLPSVAQRPTVSLLQLLAAPEKFDGKVVRFQGVANLAFEGNAIYLSKEHWKHGVTSCGLWLDISEELAQSRMWATGRYMVVEGTFSKDDRGHMGLYMGAIRAIKLFTLHEMVSPEELKEGVSKDGAGGDR